MDIEQFRFPFGEACECQVIDDSLRDFVLNSGELRQCGRCGKSAYSVSITALFKHMEACIRSEYEPESSSTEVPGPEWGIDVRVEPSDWLLSNLDDPISEELAEQFVECFTEDWIAHDVWTGPYSDNLKLSWDEFCNLVRYRVRFVFRGAAGDLPVAGIGPSSAYETLEAVAAMLSQSDAIISLPVGQPFYRVRKHGSSERPRTASELGSPPIKRTIALRMSPVGFSFFYGASDAETCLSEAKGADEQAATVGEWHTAMALPIVDLVHLPEMPGFFDLNGKRRRSALEFVEQFAAMVTKRVKETDHAEVEYVPTQIVAEFLRCSVSDEDGTPIAGIRYQSSVATGENLVLFVGPNLCADTGRELDETVMVLRGVTGRYVSNPEGDWVIERQ